MALTREPTKSGDGVVVVPAFWCLPNIRNGEMLGIDLINCRSGRDDILWR